MNAQLFLKIYSFFVVVAVGFLSCCFSLFGVHMMLWLQPTVIIFGLIMCLIAAISLVCSICKCYLFRFSIIRFSCYTINGMLYCYMNFRSVFKVVINTPNDIAIIWWLNLCILNLFIFKCVCVWCYFFHLFLEYTHIRTTYSMNNHWPFITKYYNQTQKHTAEMNVFNHIEALIMKQQNGVNLIFHQFTIFGLAIWWLFTTLIIEFPIPVSL